MCSDREKLIELLDRAHHNASAAIAGDEGDYFTGLEVEADYLINHGVTFAKDTDAPSKWISVEDEMPHAEYGESDNVLTVDGFGIVKMLYFDGGCWCRPTGETVVYENPRCRITHWMPLPSTEGIK